MTIDELIAELQRLRDEHGNVECNIESYEGNRQCFSDPRARFDDDRRVVLLGEDYP